MKPKKPLRVAVGKELQRFGRRLAASAGDFHPNHQVYDGHTLHLLLNRIFDLPDVEVTSNRRRTINVLVSAFDFRTISAGFFGVFQVARFLRTTGWNVRLVLFDNFHFCPEEFRRKFQDFPGMEHLLAQAAAASGDLERRHAHAAAMRYPRDWTDSLTNEHADFVTEHVLAPALGSSRQRDRLAARPTRFRKLPDGLRDRSEPWPPTQFRPAEGSNGPRCGSSTRHFGGFLRRSFD